MASTSAISFSDCCLVPFSFQCDIRNRDLHWDVMRTCTWKASRQTGWPNLQPHNCLLYCALRTPRMRLPCPTVLFTRTGCFLGGSRRLTHAHALVCSPCLMSFNSLGLAMICSQGEVVSAQKPWEQPGSGITVSGIGRTLHLDQFTWFGLAVWSFGCIWVMETAGACGQFAISHAVAM